MLNPRERAGQAPPLHRRSLLLITIKEGKMYMAKLTFKTDNCKGCALCVDACPKGILRIATDKINKKGHHPVECTDMDQCIGCASCYMMCPDCIIKVER